MSSDDSGSEGEGAGPQQQQQHLLGSGKARAPNRHRYKNLAERIDDVSAGSMGACVMEQAPQPNPGPLVFGRGAEGGSCSVSSCVCVVWGKLLSAPALPSLRCCTPLHALPAHSLHRMALHTQVELHVYRRVSKVRSVPHSGAACFTQEALLE